MSIDSSSSSKMTSTGLSFAERLASISEWTPQVEELAAVNRKRCVAMIQCREEIAFHEKKLAKLKNRLVQLEAEHNRATLLTNLQRLPYASTWNRLSNKKKKHKAYLLAMLKGGALPDEMKGDSWDKAVPERLRCDKDIFLARLEYDKRMTKNMELSGVPDNLRHDKEVMLQVVKLYPEAVSCCLLTADFLADEDIFRSYLSGCSTAGHRDGMAFFSNKILRNPDLMMHAFERFDGSLPFLAEFLRDDKDFAMKLAAKSKGYETLSHLLSERLKTDLDVCLTSCRKRGTDIFLLPLSMQCDHRVIEAAVKQNPWKLTHLLFSAGKLTVRKDLLADKAFLLELRPDGERVAGMIWKMIPPRLQEDRGVAVVLCKKEIIRDEAFQSVWWSDACFWRQLLQSSPGHYLKVPQVMSGKLELAVVALNNAAWQEGDTPVSVVNDLVDEVLCRFPLFVIERNRAATEALVRSLVRCTRLFDLQKIDKARWQSKEFVLEMCSVDPDLYEELRTDLVEDRDVVQEILSQGRLDLLPVFVQHMHSDLVAQWIRSAGVRASSAFDDIDEELFYNREIALAWLSTGFTFEDVGVYEEFSSDREFFIAVAEHSDDTQEIFDDFCDELLLDDKDFMTQVVKKDCSLFSRCGMSLRNDFDLWLAAFSSDDDGILVEEVLESDGVTIGMRRLANFASQVRERIQEHEAFVMFVAALSLSTTDCSISSLDRGAETTMGLKQLVADYLGFPRGEDLRQLRRVSADLARFGF